MGTALIEKDAATQAVHGLLLAVTDATIDQMEQRMLAVRVGGIDDKAGRELAKSCGKECVKARSAITAAHKEQKETALRVCQELDSEKRRLLGRVEKIESHLTEQLEAVAREEARIKKEADDRKYAIRLQMLTAAGGAAPESILRAMTEDQFSAAVEAASAETQLRREEEAKAAAAEAERKRMAAEEAERNRIESERLAAERAEFQRLQAIEDEKRAAERAELEAQRQEQARKEAELKAEQDRLAKIEADRIAAEQQAQREAEAAERARIETENRIKREAEVAEAERVAKAAAEKRLLELQPAKSKLNLLANTVMNLEVPSGLSEFTENQVQMVLNTAAESIRRIGANLS